MVEPCNAFDLENAITVCAFIVGVTRSFNRNPAFSIVMAVRACDNSILPEYVQILAWMLMCRLQQSKEFYS